MTDASAVRVAALAVRVAAETSPLRKARSQGKTRTRGSSGSGSPPVRVGPPARASVAPVKSAAGWLRRTRISPGTPLWRWTMAGDAAFSARIASAKASRQASATRMLPCSFGWTPSAL